MKTGDKVAIFGTLVSIENINATVIVSGPNGVKLTLKVFPECLELAADQRITVPEYVKKDLDEAITSELDSLDVARVYLNDGMMFSLNTKLWIDKHRTAFMHALVDGYKAEPKLAKRYLLPITGLGDRNQYVMFNSVMNAWTVSDFHSSKYVIKKYTLPTKEEIDKGPDWVRAIKAVEVQNGKYKMAKNW